MQRPGSALSKLRMQAQNLHANVTQTATEKKVYTKEELPYTRNNNSNSSTITASHDIGIRNKQFKNLKEITKNNSVLNIK